jgi:putative Holliday junction resolvase
VTGVWFGVDVGTVRVGVARSDPGGILASPVTTLPRDATGNSDISQFVALVRDVEDAGVVAGVVVGLPRTLRGREGSSAEMARDYAAELAAQLAPIPVVLADERLTTVSAERKLAQSGVRARQRRAVVDQAAAVELLQDWLDAQRASRP